jgi:hypothetical protein
MRKHVLAFTASAVISLGAFGHIAQAQSPTGDQGGGGMMGYHGMIGDRMMGGGMMSREGMMGAGRMGMGQPGGMAPMMMRMMFSLMDADGGLDGMWV